jgi:hypothetical protein
VAENSEKQQKKCQYSIIVAKYLQILFLKISY